MIQYQSHQSNMWRTNKVTPLDAKDQFTKFAITSLPPPPPKERNTANINSHIARSIELLIDTEDKNERQIYGKEILERMKLDNPDDVGDINTFMNELLQLGFSGRVCVEQVFSHAMYNAVNKCSRSEIKDDSFCKRNVKILFESKQGRQLLRRIIWCSSRGDNITATYSQDALDEICRNLNGILAVAKIFVSHHFFRVS